MNEGIELHDSAIAAISVSEASTVVSFSNAYVHRSSGVAGVESGSVYLQPATLTFTRAAPVSLPKELPAHISDGSLRIDGILYSNLIPTRGSFEGAIEFSLVLATAEVLTIRAQEVRIQLQGEPRYLEEFKR